MQASDWWVIAIFVVGHVYVFASGYLFGEAESCIASFLHPYTPAHVPISLGYFHDILSVNFQSVADDLLHLL